MSHLILFVFICFCSRLCWSWKVPISILRLMKICVRFQYVPWKNVWLCFISIASVHLSHKIEKFHLELKHNNKKDMVSHLNMSHGKMYDFVSFLKLTNFILKVIEILQIFFIRKDIKGIGWKTEAGGRGGTGGGGQGLNEKGFWRKKFCNIRYSYLLLSLFRLFFNKCGENLIDVRYGLPLHSNHKFFIFFTAIA